MRALIKIGLIGILATSCSPEKVNITLEEITISEIQEAYENKIYSAKDLTQAFLDRIKDIDQSGPSLNSVLMVNPDALEIARGLDEERADGKVRGLLHGIPILLKDNIDTHDKMPCTAGAIPMKHAMPLDDAFIVKQLREAGAVILGKANLSEWANFHSSYSSSGWSALGGQTKNPFKLNRNPCGSSAGSGVAVSASLCVMAVGTETNGSIVCPSNNNGIVGIKPTVGLLSRSGIIPISFSQDTPGPMTRTVRDGAICLAAMRGVDGLDAKTAASADHMDIDYLSSLKKDGLKGKRLGYHKGRVDNFWKVKKNMDQVVADLEAQGAEVIEIESVTGGNINSPSYQVLLYEFKDGLNKYFASLGAESPVKNMDDLIKQTFASETEMQYFDHKRITDANEKGDLTDSLYTTSLETMYRLSREEGIDKVMNEHNLDAIFSPTRGPAWMTDWTTGDNSRSVSSSSPAAISGYPSITVPAGVIDGLPHNVSFYGRAWSEPVLLEIAYAFEQATNHRIVPQFLDE